MSLKVEVQVASESADLPAETELRRWAKAALVGHRTEAELVIRIVDEAEGAVLNQIYRSKQGPTNVLSFPFQVPPEVQMPLLGDVVICAPVVRREAAEQGKEPAAHWAHMVVHGVLHLLGHDHLDDVQATAMESLETRILVELGYPDPYRETSNP